jgi:nucleoside 2-deoxyribosyltransferase
MIYIASPFFKPHEVDFVKEIEDALHAADMNFFSPRSEGVLMKMDEAGKTLNKAAIYLSNVTNIAKATHVVAVIDDRDVGTIWEMGYATAAGKNVISISNQSYGLNVMLAESVQAHVRNIPNMIEAILNPGYSGELLEGVY